MYVNGKRKKNGKIEARERERERENEKFENGF